MENVYLVVRRTPDIKDHFVEIKGIFKNEDEANKWREYIWEKLEQQTTVDKFVIMDTLE